MDALDKHYLLLQFKDKIYSKKGQEFQTFFENIAEKIYPDFQKIHPYGNLGDGANDGYRRRAGIYYQVYAPETPKINEKKAASKFYSNFQRLKEEWGEISTINEFIFVYNDEYGGSVQVLEKTVTELKKNNQQVEFKIFLAKDLENLFFMLTMPDMLTLGFNVDSRKAISIAHEYLQKIEVALDREDAHLAMKLLDNSKTIIGALNDENLALDYDILEGRCITKMENMDEAKRKYENLSIQYPNEPRSFLYLAEIYLSTNDYEKNKEYLEKAKGIDSEHWLTKFSDLVRERRLGKKIDIDKINEDFFSFDPRIKASFYRLYALFLEDSGDEINANSFIEKAIRLNSDKLSSYICKLTFLENKMINNQDFEKQKELAIKLIEEVNKLKVTFPSYEDVGGRSKAILNLKKINALQVLRNYSELAVYVQETIKLVLACYFDDTIDQILSVLFAFNPTLPDIDFSCVLAYLRNSEKAISSHLSNLLVSQFIVRDQLTTEGKKFFTDVLNQEYLNFINDLQNENYEKILKTLEVDIISMLLFAQVAKKYPNLRKKIIERLPNDFNVQKKILLILHYYDEKDIDEAFTILKETDFSYFTVSDCKTILDILYRKKAWDFEITFIEIILGKEKEKHNIFFLKLHLFYANLNLKRFQNALEIGEYLLKEDLCAPTLNEHEKEQLLSQTLLCCIERSKIDNTLLQKAEEFLNIYKIINPSFEFKIGIEANVYIHRNQPDKALKSVIEGVKLKKFLTQNEFAKLYFILVIQIGNQVSLNLDSYSEIINESFVKFDKRDNWYFVGNGEELDAIKINEENKKHELLIRKKVGEKVCLSDKYHSEQSEEIVEFIFSIDKYIIWQSIHYFQKLTKENDLPGVVSVEIKQNEGTLDLNFLKSFLEDLNKKTKPFFDIYCNGNVPLALLAVSEGNVINAISRVRQEKKGFINFSTGLTDDLNHQEIVAKRTIENNTPFYIDATSAFALVESGMFKTINSYLPNIKIPQSVINFLIEFATKFNYCAGQEGFLGYAQGQIIFSFIEQEIRNKIHSLFLDSIKILESKPENIQAISLANKTNSFFETNIPEELCDACLLAQIENLPILTEDFLYLKLTESDTKKISPEYFSSFALIRVLYEKRHINFEEYLDYFTYLSSYRFRFLTLSVTDIEKAVFGDNQINTLRPENIRKFNFQLTLSDEYGVEFQQAFIIVFTFFSKVLLDNTIAVDTTLKIFIELIEEFPKKIVKKEIGQLLLGACINLVKKREKQLLLVHDNTFVWEKITYLHKLIDVLC